MSWNLTTWNPGDPLKAAWYNRIQNVLGRWGKYGGVLASASDLPDSAEFGTWYVIQDSGTIYIYTDQGWVNIDRKTWEKVYNAPQFTDSPMDFIRPLNVIKYGIAYFPNSLVDVINGITPEGYPGTVTSYGLRQSSDGKLVVTERQDDIPFTAVKSFAVEEGTTNNNEPNILNWSASGSTKEDAGFTYLGQPVAKIADDSSTDTHYIYHLPNAATSSNGYRTFSVYAKRGGTKYIKLAFSDYNYWTGGNGAEAIFDLENGTWEWSDPSKPGYAAGIHCGDDGWCRCWITAQNISGSSKSSQANVFIMNSNKEGHFAGTNGSNWVYVTMPMEELKPFATSFVDGSRPIGSLWLPVDLTAMDNSVVAFWFKMYYANTKHRLDIADWKDSSNWNYNYSIRYDTFDNGTNAWYIAIKKRANNETPPTLYATTTKDLTDGWHFAVFVHDETTGETKAYLDGEKMIDSTFYFYKDRGQNKMNVGMPFGTNWPGQDSGAALISDLYIGKAKDSSGNLIWTDDFVRYVYNLKRPFIVE